jgi:hypothetical protein
LHHRRRALRRARVWWLTLRDTRRRGQDYRELLREVAMERALRAGVVWVAILSLAVAAQPRAAAQPPALRRGTVGVDDDVRRRWVEHWSYYAFLEIVDAQLDPDWRPGATMDDVRRELGPPTCSGPGCYPNFGPRDWYYETERRVLAGNKAILTFDDKSVLMSIDWVSE